MPVEDAGDRPRREGVSLPAARAALARAQCFLQFFASGDRSQVCAWVKRGDKALFDPCLCVHVSVLGYIKVSGKSWIDICKGSTAAIRRLMSRIT